MKRLFKVMKDFVKRVWTVYKSMSDKTGMIQPFSVKHFQLTVKEVFISVTLTFWHDNTLTQNLVVLILQERRSWNNVKCEFENILKFHFLEEICFQFFSLASWNVNMFLKTRFAVFF